ncbi:MAG: hypothetical protein Kow0089_16940 [Desulfobulbaceae bacterium]
MFGVNQLFMVTVLVILGGALYAYRKTRDGLHPAVIVALPLAYVYGIWPIVLNWDGGIEKLFGSERLFNVVLLYLVSIFAFIFGLTRLPKSRELLWIRGHRRSLANIFTLSFSERKKRELYRLSMILGFAGFAAYWYMIENVGGFVSAFSRAKGGGYAASGYIGEAVLLAFPAILLLALSRQGRKLRVQDIALALIYAAPHLIQGTFGGRRGPLFLVLSTLFICWHVAKGRMPSLRRAIIGFGVIGFAVILVLSQRQYVYIGSQADFEWTRIEDTIRAEQLEKNDYVAGVAHVMKVDFFQDFYWGYRYFVTLFIRPIPKQIWPTKYEDMGAVWLKNYEEEGQYAYESLLGFSPPRGSSIGFIADIYQEFSWGVVFVVFLLGRAYGAVWRRHVYRGGFWTMLYVEMLILIVYIPTQSFSAWFHRLAVMGVITWLGWRYYIKEDKRDYSAQPVEIAGKGRWHG